MKSKKTAREPEMNEFAAEAEKTGDISHEEAVQGSANKANQTLKHNAKMDESDVKRQELSGERKVEPLKYPHAEENNQSRVVISDDKTETTDRI